MSNRDRLKPLLEGTSESAQIRRIQLAFLEALDPIHRAVHVSPGNRGQKGWRLTDEDLGKQEWKWVQFDNTDREDGGNKSGNAVTFRGLKFLDPAKILKDPVFGDPKPADAVVRRYDNKTHGDIEAQFEYALAKIRNVTDARNNTFTWDVTASFEAGFEGFGASFNVGLSASVGGEHSIGTESSNEQSTEKVASESFTVPALSRYKAEFYHNVTPVTQKYSIRAYVDFDTIEVKFSDWWENPGVQKYSGGKRQFKSEKYITTKTFHEFRGIQNFLSAMLGRGTTSIYYPNKHTRIVKSIERNGPATDAILRLNNGDDRMISVDGELRFEQATDLQVALKLAGTFEEREDRPPGKSHFEFVDAVTEPPDEVQIIKLISEPGQQGVLPFPVAAKG